MGPASKVPVTASVILSQMQFVAHEMMLPADLTVITMEQFNSSCACINTAYEGIYCLPMYSFKIVYLLFLVGNLLPWDHLYTRALLFATIGKEKEVEF